MTTEEKLEKAIGFIKSIEQMKIEKASISDIIDDAHIYCEDYEDGCYDDNIFFNKRYVEASCVENLKDKAWHILADLT